VVVLGSVQVVQVVVLVFVLVADGIAKALLLINLFFENIWNVPNLYFIRSKYFISVVL